LGAVVRLESGDELGHQHEELREISMGPAV